MKKNSIILIFVLALISALLIFGILSQAEGEEPQVLTYDVYEYTLDSEGNATITKYLSEEPTVVIPAEIPGEDDEAYPVTVIGEGAFKESYCRNVTVPDSVKRVEAYAFTSSALREITLGKNVEYIGNQAFSYTSIETIDIPDSVVTMDTTIFWYCESLESITIGDSVESIGDYCFESCISLSSVELPDSLKTIGKYAFFNCDSLKTVTFGTGLESIGENSFCNCISLEEVIFYPGLKSVGAEAFRKCENLYKVTFDCDAPTIGEGAFDGVNEIFKIYYADCASGWDAKELSIYPLEEVQMHVYGEWQVQKEPTTEAEGLETRVCSGCGETEERKIDKLPSDDEEPAVRAWVPYVVAGAIVLVIAAFIIVYLVCSKKQKPQSGAGTEK